ncbi:MAG: hypothetical protein LUC45_04455 [Paraprevotella sp.]|nr:hypothetical protein [Paraprevotella sp.]
MRSKLKIWLSACCLIGLLGACDERTPELYSAPNGVYFNNRTSGDELIDTTAVTCVYEPDTTEYMDVPVVVQTIGHQSDEDRPVNIQVHSDYAVEGVDSEQITPAVIPAHTSSISYVVRLKRTKALQTELKSIYLELASNDYFSTFLSQEATGNDQQPYISMLTYRIDFSDFYSTAPAGWRRDYVGESSERKLRLLWKLFDGVVDREDYNVAGAIPFNKWVYMRDEVNV